MSHSELVMGIDPGSLCTGVSLVEARGARLRAVHWEVVKNRSRESFPNRLLRIHDRVSALIGEFEPATLALEDIFFAANARSTIKLGQTRGVVLLAAAQAGLALHEYSPLEVKQTLVGYGRADKEQVRTMVTRLLRLNQAPEPLDASDALAIAICHLHLTATRRRIRQAGTRNP